MHRFRAIVFGTLALLSIVGCATTTNVADGTAIKGSEGLLVFEVTTKIPDSQLQYREFSTKSSFGYFFAEEFTGPSGAFYNKAGTTYWVKKIKAGEYMWSKLAIADRHAIFHGSNRFRISPGTITYAGHLTIEVVDGAARINVADNEADIKAYLERNYPAYVKDMRFEKSITRFGFYR